MEVNVKVRFTSAQTVIKAILNVNCCVCLGGISFVMGYLKLLFS